MILSILLTVATPYSSCTLIIHFECLCVCQCAYIRVCKYVTRVININKYKQTRDNITCNIDVEMEKAAMFILKSNMQ